MEYLTAILLKFGRHFFETSDQNKAGFQDLLKAPLEDMMAVLRNVLPSNWLRAIKAWNACVFPNLANIKPVELILLPHLNIPTPTELSQASNW